MSDTYVRGQSDNLPFVSAETIANYFASTDKYTVPETRGVKIQRSKRENYGDNAIGRVQLMRKDNLCTVVAEITPEHKVRQGSYKVICKVDEVKDEIVEANCQDCAASEGGCKHEVAFVTWLHRRSEEPEPTSVTCYWQKSKLSRVGTSVKCITIDELASAKSYKKQYPSNTSFFDKVVAEMKARKCNFQMSPYLYQMEDGLSNLSLHKIMWKFGLTGRRKPDEFLSFASATMTETLCEEIEKSTRAQSESVVWTEMRYGCITASKIFDIAQCKTSEGSLVDQMIGTSKVKDTEAMARGRQLEKKVLAKMAHLLQDFSITNSGLFLDPKYPILGASPDALGRNFVVEIKCPTSSKTEKKIH